MHLSVAITPSWVYWTFMFLYLVPLATIGLFIGYVLAKKVKVRHMKIGSAIYWTFYFINLYLLYRYSYRREFLYQIPGFETLSTLIWLSAFLVPFLNVAYAIKKHRLERNVQNQREK